MDGTRPPAAATALALLTLALPGLAAAQAPAGYPKDIDNYMNDFAGVIRAEHREALSRTLRDVERQTGIEITVATVRSFREYGTGDASLESFATSLFNRWGVGNRETNDGVMVLVAVSERQCRIELGKGYGHYRDAAMKRIIDEVMIPRFKAGDYSLGIYEGTTGVVGEVTRKLSWLAFHKWHLLLGALILISILAGISCLRHGRSGWGWVFFGIAFFLIVILVKLLGSDKSSSGYGDSGSFGGGSSFGGGASGSW